MAWENHLHDAYLAGKRAARAWYDSATSGEDNPPTTYGPAERAAWVRGWREVEDAETDTDDEESSWGYV